MVDGGGSKTRVAQAEAPRKAMDASVFKTIPLSLVGIPAVEFVDIADRLPQLHPGLLASAILVALLALAVWRAYRSVSSRQGGGSAF